MLPTAIPGLFLAILGKLQNLAIGNLFMQKIYGLGKMGNIEALNLLTFYNIVIIFIFVVFTIHHQTKKKINLHNLSIFT